MVCGFTLPVTADDLGKAGATDRGGAAKMGPRDGDRKAVDPGKADAPEGRKDPKPAVRANSKEGKVFAAYDKDDDGSVTADEIAAMKEGKQNSRAKREFRKAVDHAEYSSSRVVLSPSQGDRNTELPLFR